MKTVDLIRQFQHIFGTDYTQDANCKGAWLLDVDEDPVTDSSGEGNTGAVTGATFSTAAPPAAYSTGYRIFDGIANKITITPITLTDSCSFVHWLNKTTTTASDMHIGLNDQDNYCLITDANTLRIQDAASANDDFDWTGTVFEDGVWVHLGISRAANGDTTLYANGVASDDSPINMTADLLIDMFGQGYTNDNYALDGSLDELAFFDRALDSTEINDIMDNGLVGSGAVNVTVTPNVISVTVDIQSPTVRINASVSINTLSNTVNIFSPTVRANLIMALNLLDARLTAIAPTITIEELAGEALLRLIRASKIEKVNIRKSQAEKTLLRRG